MGKTTLGTVDWQATFQAWRRRPAALTGWFPRGVAPKRGCRGFDYLSRDQSVLLRGAYSMVLTKVRRPAPQPAAASAPKQMQLLLLFTGGHTVLLGSGALLLTLPKWLSANNPSS